MSNSSTVLRRIFNDARPLVEQALDLSDKFKGFRELATANGLDWSQIKALLKAQIQDEREDDGKNRVGRIIEKADFATAYADMLGLGTAKMNENNFSSELHKRHDGAVVSVEAVMADLPPHDEDGVIIEPASAPSDAEAGQGDGTSRPSSVASPTVSTRRNQDEGDAAQPEERGTRTHGSTDGGDHEDEVASIPDTKSSDNRQVLDVPSGAVPGSALESGAQVSEVAAIAPASAAIAPVEQSPSRDVAPGAPFPCEANGWAGLEPLPQFDRRRPAA